MAVNYKIYQSNAKNATKGLYYARTAYRETVDLKKLAEIMQANCTVKYSDILAVLTELGEVMKNELLNSKPVKIMGLGTFRVSLKSRGCADLNTFNIKNSIVGARVATRRTITLWLRSTNATSRCCLQANISQMPTILRVMCARRRRRRKRR